MSAQGTCTDEQWAKVREIVSYGSGAAYAFPRIKGDPLFMRTSDGVIREIKADGSVLVVAR